MSDGRIRVFELGAGPGLGGTEQAVEGRAALLPSEFFDVYAIGVHGAGPRFERLTQRGVRTLNLRGDQEAIAQLIAEVRPHVVHYSRLVRQCAFTQFVQDACARAGVEVLVETNVFGRPAGWVQSRPPNLVGHMSMASMWRCARQSGASMMDMFASGHRAVYLPVPTLAGFGERADASRDEMRAKLAVGANELLACRIGRPDMRKWSARLEVALPRILRAIPGLKMAFMAAPLETAARLRSRYGGRVICLEPAPELSRVASLYGASDMMIHSSAIGESFGLSMAEAMYHGLPVIVDSTPAMDNAQVELVEHARSGLVVASAAGFVSATKLLAGSPELRRELGRAARDRAEACFSDVAVVGQWLRLYVEACRDARVPMPSALARHAEAIGSIPEKSSYAGYPAEYARRCELVLGGPDGPFDRVTIDLLRMRYTAGYMRQLGLRPVLQVIRSRLASTRSLRRD